MNNYRALRDAEKPPCGVRTEEHADKAYNQEYDKLKIKEVVGSVSAAHIFIQFVFEWKSEVWRHLNGFIGINCIDFEFSDNIKFEFNGVRID